MARGAWAPEMDWFLLRVKKAAGGHAGKIFNDCLLSEVERRFSWLAGKYI